MVLIGLLALSNLVGSFILQRNQVQPGQIERTYTATSIEWLEALGLFDLYHSWWFMLLLTVTGVSLVIASIDIWPRFWARVVAEKTRLSPHEFSAQPMEHDMELPPVAEGPPQDKIARVISRMFGTPVVEQEGSRFFFFAHRGRWSHLAVFVIHTGLILILIGGFIGTRYGFEGEVRLREGEQSHLFTRRGDDKVVPLGFTIRCNKTWMEKYPDGSPKSYFSELDIIKDGQVVKSKTIKVNDPLGYDGLHFYQATFGTVGVEGTEGNAFVNLLIEDQKSGKKQVQKVPLGGATGLFFKLPNGSAFGVVGYVPNFELPIEGVNHNLGEAVRIALDEGEKQSEFWVFKGLPDFDRDVRKGHYAFVMESINVGAQPINFTGLAIGYNPGISTVWLGSTILCLGLLWVIAGSHRKVWAILDGRRLRIVARASRNPVHYEKRFKKLIEQMEKELKVNLEKTSAKWQGV